jgi:hypothetical protein
MRTIVENLRNLFPKNMEENSITSGLNTEENLMNLFPKNTDEKLIWERYFNKLLVQENKELKEGILELITKISTLKKRYDNTTISVMHEKYSSIKEKYQKVKKENTKLTEENLKLFLEIKKIN